MPLPVVLPPLVFAATQKANARGLRDNARPILVLAVGLNVATTALAERSRSRRKPLKPLRRATVKPSSPRGPECEELSLSPRRLRRLAMEAALEAIRTDEANMPERVRRSVMLQ